MNSKCHFHLQFLAYCSLVRLRDVYVCVCMSMGLSKPREKGVGWLYGCFSGLPYKSRAHTPHTRLEYLSGHFTVRRTSVTNVRRAQVKTGKTRCRTPFFREGRLRNASGNACLLYRYICTYVRRVLTRPK